MAVKVAKETKKNTEWLLFPNYLGRRVRNIKFGAINPTIKPARILAAVLKNIEIYTILCVTQTETLFFWGYGVEISILLDENELEKTEDEIMLKNGRKNLM